MDDAVRRCQERRARLVLTPGERRLVQAIQRLTRRHNRDNVTRTRAYLDFYLRHPEIRWALLASMVSRNAGWNMADLTCEPFCRVLPPRFRSLLFHTYERPNWLIFDDSFPQLLLYERAKRTGKPLFHLLKALGVSVFMEMEWERFWTSHDRTRLVYAQIVNEQHVIEVPVIRHPFFHNAVFDHWLYWLQERLRFNAVVFPTERGRLYGYCAVHFKRVDARILLGKRLYHLLFDVPESPSIRSFAENVPHTGSRSDYERAFGRSSVRDFSFRERYKRVNHKRLTKPDWFCGSYQSGWYDRPTLPSYDLTRWYLKKRRRLNRIAAWMKWKR